MRDEISIWPDIGKPSLWVSLILMGVLNTSNQPLLPFRNRHLITSTISEVYFDLIFVLKIRDHNIMPIKVLLFFAAFSATTLTFADAPRFSTKPLCSEVTEPKDSDQWISNGECQMSIGYYDDAVASMSQVLALSDVDGSHSYVYVKIAHIYILQGKFWDSIDSSIAALNKKNIYHSHIQSWSNLALSLYCLDLFDECIVACDNGLQLPDKVTAAKSAHDILKEIEGVCKGSKKNRDEL